MAGDGGGSTGGDGGSDGGEAGGSAVSQGTQAVASESSESAVAAAEVSTESKEIATSDTGEILPDAGKETKPAEELAGEKIEGKKDQVISEEPVTVEKVEEKTTINKDHVVGEKKEKETKEVTKHKYADRLAKAFPDREYENDDDYDAAHEEHVVDLEGYKDRGTIANQKLIALFEAEPQVADIVRAMLNGATMRSALARHIGPEDLVSEEGDPDYSEYEKNNKERLERVDKTNQFNKEFNENVEFSTKSIKEFAEENNLEPEEAEKILGEFDDMLKDIYRGKITKETLTKIMRAVQHDEAVKEAKEEGIVAGKNEKVKAEKEKVDKVDDGMPVVKKSGEAIEEEVNEKPEQQKIIDRIFDAGTKRSNF